MAGAGCRAGAARMAGAACRLGDAPRSTCAALGAVGAEDASAGLSDWAATAAESVMPATSRKTFASLRLMRRYLACFKPSRTRSEPDFSGVRPLHHSSSGDRAESVERSRDKQLPVHTARLQIPESAAGPERPREQHKKAPLTVAAGLSNHNLPIDDQPAAAALTADSFATAARSRPAPVPP